MRDDGDFISELRKEIGCAEDRRASYVRQKITFVISFLGVGSISFISEEGTFETWVLFYIAPIVAFVFDCYVLAESVSIKRAGVFIRACPVSPKEERIYEIGVSKHRGILAKVGGVACSGLVLIAAMLGLFIYKKVDLVYWIWAGGMWVILILLWSFDRQALKRLKNFETYIQEVRENYREGKK